MKFHKNKFDCFSHINFIFSYDFFSLFQKLFNEETDPEVKHWTLRTDNEL